MGLVHMGHLGKKKDALLFCITQFQQVQRMLRLGSTPCQRAFALGVLSFTDWFLALYASDMLQMLHSLLGLRAPVQLVHGLLLGITYS